MKLWLLTSEYPPDFGGGISAYTYHTARMLTQRGHEVTVFVTAEDLPTGWQVEETSHRLRVVRFAANQSPQSSVLGAWARWSYDAALVLRDFICQDGLPDVIESQEYLGLPYFLLQRKLLLEEAFQNIPLLVTVHTPLFICYHYDKAPAYRFPAYWSGEMERFSMAAADGVVFPSTYLRRLVENNLPQIKGRSHVIPNPYQDDQLQPFHGESDRRKGFLFTARIQRLKGIEPLLEAFRRLWDEGVDEPLTLMGGDWYDELSQCWMSETLQAVYKKYLEQGLLNWRGKQPPQEIRAMLNQVRAMILPSLVENYPYAVLEAMSAGCPAMVSSSGGHAEIVEDKISGFIFSHEQAGDLEEKIQEMLSLSQTEWERMSSAAHARVEQISGYQTVAPQKEALLWSLMNERRERRYFPFLRGEGRPRSSKDAEGEKPGFLSIVIPFYNLGDFIGATLESLSQMTDIPHEIIVVDDGSDDPHSLATLAELKGKFSFQLLRKSHEGVSAARNAGAQIAQGEFLAFLDADDCVDVCFYPQALAVLRNYENVSFVGCWAEYFGEAQGYWPTWNSEPPYALVHNPLNTSALIHRRADFLLYGMNDSRFINMEDYDSLLSMIENGCRGVSIPDPYFKYRVRQQSSFHKSSPQVIMTQYAWLSEKHPRLYNQFGAEVTALLNTNGPGWLYDNPTLWYPAVGYTSDQPKVEMNELLSQLDNLKLENQAFRSELGEIHRSRYWKVIRWLWSQPIYLIVRNIILKTSMLNKKSR
ncbi:MAG: glycosyltransferase [Chloroflexota bacterium]